MNPNPQREKRHFPIVRNRTVSLSIKKRERYQMVSRTKIYTENLGEASKSHWHQQRICSTVIQNRPLSPFFSPPPPSRKSLSVRRCCKKEGRFQLCRRKFCNLTSGSFHFFVTGDCEKILRHRTNIGGYSTAGHSLQMFIESQWLKKKQQKKAGLFGFLFVFLSRKKKRESGCQC